MFGDNFQFGASFVPYAKSEDMPMSEWENDIKKMKELGFNTIRSFAAWDRIERQEGIYDFDKLDYIIELVEKYNIKLIINAGGAFSNLCSIYAPRWIIRDYKCQHVTGAPGKLGDKPFGPRRFICMDDPVCRDKSEIFIAKVVERYRSSKALAAWSVWNEPILGYPCCCPHTLKNFRDWVKNKYNGDLDLLNREWGSEFPVDYLSWDEVEPGLEAGFAGGYLPAMDWFSFNEEKITANVKRVNDLIKKVDNQHPTTVNIITYADRELHYFNNVTALGKAVDIIGYSHYLFSDKPYETAANLDIIRSASNDPDRKYWIIETEAGPLRYYGDFYSGSGEDGIREKANWQAIAHGTKTILLWKYRGRISDKQTDEYNLMAWDGEVTERAKRAGRTSQQLQKLAAVINPGKNVSQVAIFHSDITRKYVNLDDGSLDIRKKWLDSRTGAYKVLWDLNIPVDFVNETQIVDGLLDKYKMLVIPFGAVIGKDVAGQLKEFVANGGNIVADLYLGAQKENCRINYQAPGEGLDKVFGGYYNDIVTAASAMSDKITFTDRWSLPELNAGEAFCELHEYPDSEVLARYASGKAAVIKNQYGKGVALMCGSGVFASYLDGKNPGLKPFIKKFLNESEITADAEINMPQGTEDQINNIEICQLSVEKQNDSVWMIVNHNEVSVEFSLKFSDGVPGCEFYELLNNQKITTNENAQLQLSMPGFATFILMPANSELCKSLVNECAAASK